MATLIPIVNIDTYTSNSINFIHILGTETFPTKSTRTLDHQNRSFYSRLYSHAYVKIVVS